MDESSPPVFVHSSFRTASTWIWSRFRALKGVIAYYEYLNPGLSTVKPEEVSLTRPDAWRSGHPETAPYFLEFLPLIKSEGGVAGHDPTMAFARFIPEQEELSQSERAYVARLIRLATEVGKAPVLTETRSLGRVSALRKAFGGFHILLVRNLYQQWCSYSNQRLNGNSYFHEQTAAAISASTADPYMLFLSRQPQSSDDDSLVVFLGFHLYLYLRSAPACDLIVDVNTLRDSDYRRRTENSIGNSGLHVDLRGSINVAQSPAVLISDPESVRVRATSLLSKAVELLPGANSSLGQQLLDEFWAEQDLVRTYSAPSIEQLDRSLRKLHAGLARILPALSASAAEKARDAFDLDRFGEGYELSLGESIAVPADAFVSPKGSQKLGRITCDLDEPGFLVFGPYRYFPTGGYRVEFDFEVQGQISGGALTIDVLDEQWRQLATRTIDLNEDAANRSLLFVSCGGPLEFRVLLSQEILSGTLQFFGVRVIYLSHHGATERKKDEQATQSDTLPA